MRRGLSIILCLLMVGAGSIKIKQLVEKMDQSSITYTLKHPLQKIEAISRVARYTVDVDVATKTIRRTVCTVDVLTFHSGNADRDVRAMEAIDAQTYPEVRFTSSSIEQKGDSLLIHGKLTFHGVTKDAVARARRTWSQQNLKVDGSIDISLSAYGVKRPSFIFIPVEDNLNFTFHASLTLDGATDVSHVSE